MQPQWRCLVPVTAFCEYASGKPTVPHWFALGKERPLFAFAGLWRPWTGTRGTKVDPVEGEHQLFAFLNVRTERCRRADPPQSDAGRADHAGGVRRMDDGAISEALELQRPLGDELLSVVARGEKEDPPAVAAKVQTTLLL